MQNGKIRSYSQDKRYGFIHGDDGESYFFHLNDVAEPGSGVAAHKFVVFDNKPTPKGMAAIKVTVKDPVGKVFSAPSSSDIIFSKSSSCGKNNEAVYVGRAFTREARSPDDARQALKNAAGAAGFNAVLDVSRDQDTYSGPFDGNYKYTIHSFTGVPALVKQVRTSMDEAEVAASKEQMDAEIAVLKGMEIKSRYHSDGDGYVYAALFGLVLAIFIFGVFLIGNTA